MKPLTKTLAALLLTIGLAAPGVALACGPGGPGGGMGKGPGPGKMVRMLEKNADALGIEQATLDQIQSIVKANKAQAESLRADVKAARQALREAMQAPNPDKQAVLALQADVGAAKQAAAQHRLSVMLDVKALLTPEQQTALEEKRQEMRGKWGKRGKRGGKWGKGGPEAEL